MLQKAEIQIPATDQADGWRHRKAIHITVPTCAHLPGPATSPPVNSNSRFSQ